MNQLIVYQFTVTRDHEDEPDYMIFESGNFSHPLMVLNSFEAHRLRDALTAALEQEPQARPRKKKP